MIGAAITAWLDVRSKPLRTFAAIACMVAAVMAVIVVDAAGMLSRTANDAFITSQYGRTATLRIARGDGATANPADLTQAGEHLVKILKANGVPAVTAYNQLGMVFLHDASRDVTNTMWVSSTFPIVSFVDLAAGSIPVATATSTVPHAVVTMEAARALGFTGVDAVGARVLYVASGQSTDDLRTTPLLPLVIDGVARSLGTGSDRISVLVVSDLTQPDSDSILGSQWLVHVNPSDIGLVQGLTASVKVGTSNQTAFAARRIDLTETLAPLLSQQSVTARAVTWVALIVGGLGILGVGLASVRERGKDFGLRRALGASKRLVFAGVILQTVIEALLAAAIAVPLSAIIVQSFTRTLVLAELPLPSSTGLPVSSAVHGVVAALAVGLLAGLLPAFRAARASVVQALRD